MNYLSKAVILKQSSDLIKFNSKWIIDPSVKCKTTKLLGANIQDFGFGNGVLDKHHHEQHDPRK